VPKKAKPPVWVLRWHGPFGVAYIGKNREIVSRGKDSRRYTVFEVAKATVYRTRDAAESAALVLGAEYPERFLAKLEPREWDGRRKRP
jgi:hypothetical protein